ncbi:MAG: LamG-like jellyroll fold domain-containing protein [Verrucomicrobiota bacterium]
MKTQLIPTFAAVALLCSSAQAVTTSINSGSLGAAGNGTNADGVTLGVAGPLAASGDTAAGYSGGANTTVPFNAALNPASASPFTIEFWANPATNTDGSGPSPLFNRVTGTQAAPNRSGWVFFQRPADAGWNFAMYNGLGSQVGLQVTGGTYTPGSWSHVVAVWDGAAPTLFVNGVNTNAPVVVGGPGGYNASGTAIFSVGAYDTGSNPFNGAVDETAFYSKALSPAEILAHYEAAASTTPGFYSNLVTADGAVLYLNNVPEPTSAVLMLLGLAGVMRRRRN